MSPKRGFPLIGKTQLPDIVLPQLIFYYFQMHIHQTGWKRCCIASINIYFKSFVPLNVTRWVTTIPQPFTPMKPTWISKVRAKHVRVAYHVPVIRLFSYSLWPPLMAGCCWPAAVNTTPSIHWGETPQTTTTTTPAVYCRTVSLKCIHSNRLLRQSRGKTKQKLNTHQTVRFARWKSSSLLHNLCAYQL